MAQLNSIPVFFRPEMVATNAGSFSPSAAKPALVVEDWKRLAAKAEQPLPIELRRFEPVSAADLARAHDRAYVDGVLSLEEPNGFNNRDPEVAQSLRYTSGAMLAAAREALANRAVACAPVSGFHHAGHAWGGGFCTFNGLMVTAAALLADASVRRVAILDLDQHFGDGTQDILQKLKLGRQVLHHGVGPLGQEPEAAEGYLRRLPALVASLAECDLLLYQAGADAHVNDPLGGWMTSEQLARRDQIVFETARRIGLPVAWNLAGGYQRDVQGSIEPVLAIHRATVQACAAAYVHDHSCLA